MCACGCGSQTAWLNWRHGYARLLKGHNARIYDVYSEEEAKKIAQKRSASLTGRTGWAKGLTKETDERVASRAKATSIGRKAAFDEGRLTCWSKGLTKETDERVAEAADTLKQKYTTGECAPWTRGLTKDTDERVADMAARVSLKLNEKSLREYLDGIKRLQHDEIVGRIEVHDTLEVVGGLDEYVNDASRVIEVKCKTCGTNFTSSLRQLQYGRCWNCTPAGSATQGQIDQFVRSVVGGQNVITNDRKTFAGKLELDIFVPSHGFAIEYNGLYWHSILFKSKIYHANKTQSCVDKNIRLLHVFQDDWMNNRRIVESTIMHRLGKTPTKIGARKCTVVRLPRAERKKFFNENHLDGDVACRIAWGLKYNDQIVCAISLRQPVHKKYAGMLEIARSATKTFVSVPGGLSRLVRVAIGYARENAMSNIITYVDTRLSGTNRSYEQAGFKYVSSTSPRFWWTDFTNRYDRFKYRANKSLGLTEAQVAEQAGVVKIWGCSNLVYSLAV